MGRRLPDQRDEGTMLPRLLSNHGRAFKVLGSGAGARLLQVRSADPGQLAIDWYRLQALQGTSRWYWYQEESLDLPSVLACFGQDGWHPTVPTVPARPRGMPIARRGLLT